MWPATAPCFRLWEMHQLLSTFQVQCRRPRLLADEHTTPRMRNYHGRRARLSCRKPLFRTAQATVHGRLLVAIPYSQQQSTQLVPISSKPHPRAKGLTSPCIHHLWHWRFQFEMVMICNPAIQIVHAWSINTNKAVHI